MCGICGFTGTLANANDVLDNMMNKIVHRGPDSGGKHIDQNVALGFRRLSIIDLDHGSQPMYNETDDIETENNLVTVNSMSENVQENNLEKQNDSSTEQQEIIGKEEQESNTGNIEINNAQKAIELAKEEWAISVDFYNFQAELQSDGTYKVTVSNKTTTAYITSYIVNIETNTVLEE